MRYVITFKSNKLTMGTGVEAIKDITSGTKKCKDYTIDVHKNDAGMYNLYLNGEDKFPAGKFESISEFEADGTEKEAFAGAIDAALMFNHSFSLSAVDEDKCRLLVTLDVDKSEAVSTEEMADFEDDIKEVVENGIMSEEEAEARIKWAMDCLINPALIKRVIKTWRYEAPGRVKVPKSFYKITDAELAVKATRGTNPNLIVFGKLLGKSAILTGDMGCGKNVLLDCIAWLFNVPMYMYTFNDETTHDELYGARKTLPIELNELPDEDANDLSQAYLRVQAAAQSGSLGSIEMEDYEKSAKYQLLRDKAASVAVVLESTPFTDYCKDENPHAMFCANEFNLARANTATGFFNPLTDETGIIEVPGLGRVEIPKTKTVVCTQNMNSGSNNVYQDRKKQDPSTKSRFIHINFDSPKAVSELLRAKFPDRAIDKDIYAAIDKFWETCQGTVEATNMRGLISALDMFSAIPGMMNITECMRIGVFNGVEPKSRASVESIWDECYAAKCGALR